MLSARVSCSGAETIRSAHLLDRGKRQLGAQVVQGGGPATPLPIAFPGAGPMDSAAGFAMGVGAFGVAPMSGAFVGNLFLPGADYPSAFLTGGSTPGFLVTGVFAWHSPFLKTGMSSAIDAGSTRRILAVAAAAIPTSAMAAAAVGPAGFGLVTASGSSIAVVVAGTQMPGIVGMPGNLTPFPIVGTMFPAVFCGLAIGGAGFIDLGWIANGVGAVIPPGPMPMAPPTRAGFPPPFFVPGSPIVTLGFTATPQTQIAGCFAAGATTPVELQSFHVL